MHNTKFQHMTTKIETQIKAHWAKVVFALAAASITIITKTGDAVATRVSDLVFKAEKQSMMFESCKKQDSAIKAIHAHDMSLITESIEKIKASNSEIKASYSELEKKIDMQSAMMDGYFKGINQRTAKYDSTKPCAEKTVTVFCE